MKWIRDRRLLKRARRMGVIIELMVQSADRSPEAKQLAGSVELKEQLRLLKTLQPGPLGKLLDILEEGVPEQFKHLLGKGAPRRYRGAEK
jgi:hypothetical protein